MDKSMRAYLETNFNLNFPPPSTSSNREETLVIFKETMFTSMDGAGFNFKPVSTQKSNELTYANILQTFETNKYLNLPRLSSINHFLDLCPSWSPNDYFEAGLVYIRFFLFPKFQTKLIDYFIIEIRPKKSIVLYSWQIVRQDDPGLFLTRARWGDLRES